MERRRRGHPQPPLLRFEPLPGHRHRHPGVPQGRAGGVLRQHRPPPRHRGGDPRAHHRHPGRLRRGDAVRGHQALRGGPAQRGPVGVHPAQQPRRAPAPGRSRRPDRVGPARRAPLQRAAGTLRDGHRAHRDPPAHGLHRAGAAPAHRRDPRRRVPRRGLPRRRRQEPRRAPSHQGLRAGQGRRHRDRPHRVRGPGRDRVQRAVRRLDQGRLLLRHPLAAARCGDQRESRCRRIRARSAPSA